MTETAQLEKSGFLVNLARRASARVPPKNAAKYVVLAIEDDASLRALIGDIFARAGYEVRFASNLAEINAALKRGEELDIVLLDVTLPDANGLDLLVRLRKHPRFEKLPVIMMTAKSSAKDVSAGLAAGADGYVSKPFQISGLVKVVTMVLGNE